MARILLVSWLTLMTLPAAFGQSVYKRPPEEVTRILDAPQAPAVSINPTRTTMALIDVQSNPSIADMAEPMLRLAGLRINPKTNGPSSIPQGYALAIQGFDEREPTPLNVPNNAKLSYPIWSPDGKKFAITNTVADGIELWGGTVADKNLRKLTDRHINDVVGNSAQWLNNETLLMQLVPENRTPPSETIEVPDGPVVQESSGKAAPVRTFQDLLKNPRDAELFEYHATSQLAKLDFMSGKMTPIGTPNIYVSIEPSPNGELLLVERLHKPFSYLHTYRSFPTLSEIWNLEGKLLQTIYDAPLQDSIPIEGVPTGPRSIQWINNVDASLLWAEALDEGDPKNKVEYRDELFRFDVQGIEKKRFPVAKLKERYAGVSFMPSESEAMVTEYDRDRRWIQTHLVQLKMTDSEPKLVFDRSIQDRYNDPGRPLTTMLPNGERVIQTAPNGDLFLVGSGSSPEGDYPFLQRFDIDTKETTLIYKSPKGEYNRVLDVLDDVGDKLLLRKESPSDPPNYYLWNKGKETRLTHFEDPYPDLRTFKKQLVKTERPDGVTISFTLYTPPNIPEGKKLPTIFWAYPQEFNSKDNAGQITGSQNQFITLRGYSHMFFLTQGYAVMDDVSMPIVGPTETANDTFIDQLQANAKAAIDKASEIAPIDRNRIGIGGHSYGAFMTANLLAHSDLFRAGIARSGAYNRTLTPFGFQNERRTFWEAPEIYGAMSPFYHASKIDEPLLLIHGQADNNSGTFPLQSERLYQAVRGTGGTIRLVLLPHESHGYRARESIEHVLYEMISWFDMYVKNAPERPAVESND